MSHKLHIHTQTDRNTQTDRYDTYTRQTDHTKILYKKEKKRKRKTKIKLIAA